MRKITFSLMGLILLILISATCVERLAGTDVAVRYFYTAPWTIGLWLVTVCCSVAYLCKERRSKHLNRWTFLFHFAFPIILLGAFMTHIMGREGSIHLRLGEPTSVFEVSDLSTDELPFRLTLEDFRVVCLPGADTPEDFVCSLIVSESITQVTGAENSTWEDMKDVFRGQTTEELPDMSVSDFMVRTEQVLASEKASVNHPARFRGWRFCYSSYDDDNQGVTLLVSYDPVGTAITYLGYAWFLVFFLLYLLLGNRAKALQHHHHHHHHHHHVVLLFLLLLPLSAYASPLEPVFRSPLLSLHVLAIVLAYVLFAIVMCNGVVAFFLSPDAKRGARHQSDKLLRWAVGLLAVGIFLGAIRANVSLGRYWAWTPKEVWLLITLLVYAAPLHRKSLTWFQNVKFYYAYVIVAFLSVLISCFCMN